MEGRSEGDGLYMASETVGGLLERSGATQVDANPNRIAVPEKSRRFEPGAGADGFG